jgi:hypothetical protein
LRFCEALITFTNFKSWAVEKTNFSNQTSEAALAHMIRNASEAAYNRSDVFAKRKKLMEQWANFLSDHPQNVFVMSK